eukprot:Rhum_TRINITY_DN14643_c11_g2::Rhum_TRINITY_DN14643_c11_g2_i2::g.107451::m.107451
MGERADSDVSMTHTPSQHEFTIDPRNKQQVLQKNNAATDSPRHAGAGASASLSSGVNPLQKRLTKTPIEMGKVEKLRVMFSRYDTNGDGSIDPDEMKQLLGELGVDQEVTTDEVSEFCASLDKDGDGSIGFDEFVRFYKGIEKLAKVDTSEKAAAVVQARLNKTANIDVKAGNTSAATTPPSTPPLAPDNAQTEEAQGETFTSPNNKDRLKIKGLLDLVKASADEDAEEYITDKKKAARQRIYDLMYDLPCFAPDYLYRRWWDCIVLLIMMYHWIVATVQGIFSYEPTRDMIIVELIVTILMVVDIAVCLNTAIQAEDRAFYLVVDRKEIMKLYARSGMLFVDVLSGFPFDIIMWYAVGAMGWRVCRFLRLLKGFRLFSLFSLTDRGNMDPAFVQFYFWTVPLLKILTKMVFMGNLMTVIRMIIVSTGGVSTNCELYDQDRCQDSLTQRYLYSVWWCWALLTTQGLARVDDPPSFVYAAIVMAMSLLLQGHVIAHMSALLIKSDVAEQNRDSMRETLAIMRQYQIPASLQQEVLSFQYHSLQQNAASGFAHILERLPLPMQKEVGLYVRVDLIAKVPMFEDLSVDCKLELANCLEQTYCEPDCFIIEYGERGNEMYFMMHGFADVIVPAEGEDGTPDPTLTYGTVVTTIKRGDFFGEMALLNPELTRTASIQALSYCDMFQLHNYDFKKLLKDHEELRVRVEAEADLRGIKEKHGAARPNQRRRSSAFVSKPPTFLDEAGLAHVLGRPRRGSRPIGDKTSLRPEEAKPSRPSSQTSLLREISPADSSTLRPQSFIATQSFRRQREARAERKAPQSLNLDSREPRARGRLSDAFARGHDAEAAAAAAAGVGSAGVSSSDDASAAAAAAAGGKQGDIGLFEPKKDACASQNLPQPHVPVDILDDGHSQRNSKVSLVTESDSVMSVEELNSQARDIIGDDAERADVTLTRTIPINSNASRSCTSGGFHALRSGGADYFRSGRERNTSGYYLSQSSPSASPLDVPPRVGALEYKVWFYFVSLSSSPVLSSSPSPPFPP